MKKATATLPSKSAGPRDLLGSQGAQLRPALNKQRLLRSRVQTENQGGKTVMLQATLTCVIMWSTNAKTLLQFPTPPLAFTNMPRADAAAEAECGTRHICSNPTPLSPVDGR